MNFYLEEITGDKKRLNFPIVPDEVNVSSGANTIPLNIIKNGEARIPRGEKATGYSWDGLLPGKSMKGAAFINTEKDNWQSATDLIKILEKWKKKGTPLKFICGKFINADVFIENFNRRYYGLNHCEYSITLTKYPTLTVSVSPAPKKTDKTDPKDVGKKGKVTKDVAYRSGPGKSYTKLGTLKKGTEVTIYAVSGNWYKIKEESTGSGTGHTGLPIGQGGALLQKFTGFTTTTGTGVFNPSVLGGSTQPWWVCATYVKITNGKPTKKTPTTPQYPYWPFTGGSGSGSGSGGGSSGTGGKKPKSPHTSTGDSGGKKPIKVTLPTPKRSNTAPKMTKPSSSKPK